MKKIAIIILISICYYTQLDAQNSIYKCVHKTSCIHAHVAKHQSIAIIPMEVNIIDNKLLKDKKSDPAIIEERERQFQSDFQVAFYKRLNWMKNKNILKNIVLQDIAITNQLLFDNGIKSMHDLVEMKYSDIAKLLGVDAIFCGDVEIIQQVNRGQAFLLEMMTKAEVTSEKSQINLKLRDREKGVVIWRMHQTIPDGNVIVKTEKMIYNILKKRLTKNFPYHKKF